MRIGLIILASGALLLAGCGQSSVDELVSSRPAGDGQEAKMATTTQPAGAGFHQFVVRDIDGHDKALADYKGKVLLVVNVASKCGYTPQYAGLEKLYEKYRDKGLVVLGFPSNDFRGQEPGTEAEIKAFCSTQYNVTFPLMSKSSVKNGPEQSQVYQYLSKKAENGVLDAKVSWNFNKFLVSRDGRVLKHYESKVKPDSPELTGDIEAALKQ